MQTTSQKNAVLKVGYVDKKIIPVTIPRQILSFPVQPFDCPVRNGRGKRLEERDTGHRRKKTASETNDNEKNKQKNSIKQLEDSA